MWVNEMNKNIFKVLLLILLSVFPSVIFASPGCCSHHGGIAGCVNGHNVCYDGTTSSCECYGKSDGSYYGNGGSKNYNNGSSGGVYYDKNNKIKDDNGTSIIGIIVLVLILYPILSPILEGLFYLIKDEISPTKNNSSKNNYSNYNNNSNFKSEIKNHNKVETKEKQKSKVVLAYDKSFDLKVDKVNERKKTSNSFLYDDPSIKYNKISIIYNNNIVECMVYTYTNASNYSSNNKPVYMHNLSKNISAYNLYKDGIFNMNLVANFNSSDISIVDKNGLLRKLYNFKSKEIKTKNLLKTNIVIKNMKQFKFRIIINNINGNKKLSAIISLDQLILFSKLCQGIKIKEGK